MNPSKPNSPPAPSTPSGMASLSGIPRWPNVPACYGWVALDARGRWRLGPDGGELVFHAGLIGFLNQNYRSTPDGAWFIQNGPQCAFVAIERAPYIVRLDAKGALTTHTGLEVFDVRQALIDDDGHAYLTCELGLVGIDDRDLGAMLADDDAGNSGNGETCFRLAGQLFELVEIDKHRLAERFGFIAFPKA